MTCTNLAHFVQSCSVHYKEIWQESVWKKSQKEVKEITRRNQSNNKHIKLLDHITANTFLQCCCNKLRLIVT